MTPPETTVSDNVLLVNGPEDHVPDWDSVRWTRIEDEVRRLRQRIFAASQAGDHKKVRNLQKLMLRSRANALLSVRRVTELNAGRKTAGVDGAVVVDAEQKTDLVDWLQHRTASWSPRPVKRVYVPKSNGRRRPLGIPVIADRCLQALTVNALEPEWEARFEPKSYGFRPGRAATTRSWRSTRRRVAPTPSVCGCSTPISRRRSIDSTMITSISRWGCFRLGNWSGNG